jgi:5-methylcytosine-specific restriction endonuclease McrA
MANDESREATRTAADPRFGPYPTHDLVVSSDPNDRRAHRRSRDSLLGLHLHQCGRDGRGVRHHHQSRRMVHSEALMPLLRRLCPGCRSALLPPRAVRCPRCARRHEQYRGSRTARGYDEDYQRLRPEVLKRDRFICRYCGRKAKTVDHVVPLARGGASTMENMIAACVSCNSARGARN